MSSYNFLKAVGDGLAEAINYRTNLKRRRREEEYDYNKKWERNENEYQRDLQRGRNEEQWNFDLKQKRTEQERARKEDWLNANSPYYDIQTNDPLSYDIYDARAAINDVPIAAKYREPVKDTLSDWKAKEDYKNALAMQRDAAKAARGGGGQPKDDRTTMQKNAEWIWKLPPEKRKKLQELGLIPNSVKGGSGKGEKEYHWETDKELEGRRLKISEIDDKISQLFKTSRVPQTYMSIIDKLSSYENLSDKDKQELNKQYEEVMKKFKESDRAALEQLIKARNGHIKSVNRYLSVVAPEISYDNVKDDYIEIPIEVASASAALGDLRRTVNEANNKSKELGSRTTMGSGQTVFPQQQTLYSDGTASNSAVLNQPERMPTDIKPLAVRQFSPNEDVFITGRTPADMNLPVGYEMAVKRLQSDWMNKRISFEEYNRGLELLNNHYFGGTI